MPSRTIELAFRPELWSFLPLLVGSWLSPCPSCGFLSVVCSLPLQWLWFGVWLERRASEYAELFRRKSGAEAGYPFREPWALSFTWQKPRLYPQKQLSTGSKVLILKDLQVQPLSPGALAVGARGRHSPDGEQLASTIACQMWPAGLASRPSWIEVTNSEWPGPGAQDGTVFGWPGEVCLNHPPSLLLSSVTSLPALVGGCFHNRKIKSIRHCSKMSVCCKLVSNSSIVSGLRRALRPAVLLLMGSRAEREF